MSFHVSSEIDLIWDSKSTPFITNNDPSVIHVHAVQYNYNSYFLNMVSSVRSLHVQRFDTINYSKFKLCQIFENFEFCFN